MATASEVLSIAASQLGYSRWDDPRQGTKYGRWFAEITEDAYYAHNGVPYCAMFVSWVLAKADQSCVGFPGAYCPTILAAARRAGLAVAYSQALPGDIVFFDWDGGETDHVGFVEINKGSYYQTIEGNTSNGIVARRTRALSTVSGVIRPPYAIGRLDIDGWVGTKTVAKWQEVMHTQVDGIISGQSEWLRRYLPNIYAIEYGEGGSALVRAVQKAVGATQDGMMGKQTVMAIQDRIGVDQDGYFGAQTAKALQRRLNNNTF